jgi:hypothetical protein
MEHNILSTGGGDKSRASWSSIFVHFTARMRADYISTPVIPYPFRILLMGFWHLGLWKALMLPMNGKSQGLMSSQGSNACI